MWGGHWHSGIILLFMVQEPPLLQWPAQVRQLGATRPSEQLQVTSPLCLLTVQAPSRQRLHLLTSHRGPSKWAVQRHCREPSEVIWHVPEFSQ